PVLFPALGPRRTQAVAVLPPIPRHPVGPPPSRERRPMPVHTTEETPHIAAIRRSKAAGFRFLHLPDSSGQTLIAIHAERRHGEVVDTETIRSRTEALAARFRTEDYPSGDPLWQEHGMAADVITALLALPPHGTPGAPKLARPASSALWLPGC